MLRRLLSIATALVFAFGAVGPSLAQAVPDQLSQLRTTVDALTQRIQDLENAEQGRTTQLIDLLNKVIAATEAQRRTGLGPVEAAAELPATLSTADSAITSLETLRADGGADGLGNTSDGKPLLPELIQCASTVRDAAKAASAQLTVENAQAAIAQCDGARVQQLLSDLNKNREAAIEAYKQCRDALIRGKKVFAENLPPDPTNMPQADVNTVKQTLAALEDLTEETAACRDQLSGLIDDVRNMDNSAAAMAAVMNMAATMCMASGTNPYVCGAIFVIALLAQLFGGGKGDGDGDGQPGSGGGNSKPGGMGNMPAGDGNGKEPKPAVQQSAGRPGGEFGETANGTLKCDFVTGTKLQCSLIGNPSAVSVIDPANVARSNRVAEGLLRKAIAENQPASIVFCSGAPSVAVKAINILHGDGTFTSVGLVADVLNRGQTALDFGPGGPLPAGAQDVQDKQKLGEALC